MTEESLISKFYSNKKILIAGGTGFMGKVLVWKLLHSCPELEIIYMLMRTKYGKTATSRKEEIFNSPIFNNLKKYNPQLLEKVVIINGDVGEEGIGLSDEDRNILINEVSIVFHGAAILKMDVNLRTAININTVGTARMLDMASQMKQLQAFVYISTAYCCCDNASVEEKIYPSKQDPWNVINLTRWMDPKMLETITPKLIFPLPNTYIYSKRLTECLLLNYESKVPLIVARPSTVISSYKEPVPGWIDTFNGPAGFFAAAGRGIMRTSMMNFAAKTDMIPVDIAINSLITLPWANSKEQLMKEISVYNVSQNAYEDMTWLDVVDLFINSFEKYPPGRFLWYPNFHSSTNNVLQYTIKNIFFHYLPAYIIDFILMIIGQKPFLLRVHNKLRQGEKVLKYFTQQKWLFKHEKLLKIDTSLNEIDKRIFPVNMKEITDFQSYIDDIALAAKLFIFKEDIETLDKAKRTAKILYVVDKIVLVLRYFVLWKILVFVCSILFSFVIKLYQY